MHVCSGPAEEQVVPVAAPFLVAAERPNYVDRHAVAALVSAQGVGVMAAAEEPGPDELAVFLELIPMAPTTIGVSAGFLLCR